jgi:hypothetical protein
VAYTVQAMQCVLRAKQRAGLEGASGTFPDDEWIDMLNVSYAHWYDLIRTTPFGGQYFRGLAKFSTTSGTSYYAQAAGFPADFLSAISVDWFVSGVSLVVNILPFQEEHRNIFRFWPIGWLFNQPIFFQVWGSGMQFIPVPQAVFTVQLNYIPTAPQLAKGGQFDSINGWEEWIVCDMAAMALMKDGQADMLGAIEARKGAEESRIRGAAASRQAFHAEVVHDVVSPMDEWSM